MNCRIVIADDSEDDLLLFERALKQSCAPAEVVATLGDGGQALAYLSGQSQYADRERFPLPDLLVLDIKMPGMTGLQVLEWLQTQHFPAMRVVILSGSFLDKDIEAATRLNANAYMIKPCNPSELVEMIHSLVALC